MVPTTHQTDRPRLGLALSGGAGRGIAHIGVLRALEENRIPINAIAGASAGALVGGCYAAGMSITQLEDMAQTFRWRHMGRIAYSRLGLQSNKRMESFLRARLPVTRFEELRIPFAAMVMDLRSGALIVMRDRGDLPFAIRASNCLPVLYAPIEDSDGRLLVDGGLVANLPVNQTRKLGVEIVVAVDVGGDGARFMNTPRTALGVLTQVFVALERIVSNQERGNADLVIIPRVGHIRWDETKRADEFLKAGYEAGLESIDKIKELIARHGQIANRTESFV